MATGGAILLRRIVGEVDVAQDPARHRKEPIGDLNGKGGVRLLVTSLGSDHEIGIHASSALWHRFSMHSYGMGRKVPESFNVSARACRRVS